MMLMSEFWACFSLYVSECMTCFLITFPNQFDCRCFYRRHCPATAFFYHLMYSTRITKQNLNCENFIFRSKMSEVNEIIIDDMKLYCVYANDTCQLTNTNHYQVWFNLNSACSKKRAYTHMHTSSTLVCHIKCKWAFIQFIATIFSKFNSIYSHLIFFTFFGPNYLFTFQNTNFNVCNQFLFDWFEKKTRNSFTMKL